MSDLRGNADTFKMAPLLQGTNEDHSFGLLVLPPPELDESSYYWSDVGFERHVDLHVGEGAHRIIQHGRSLLRSPNIDSSIANFNAVDNLSASFDTRKASTETFDGAHNSSAASDRDDISTATYTTVDQSTAAFEQHYKETEDELADIPDGCLDMEGLSPSNFSVKSGEYDPSEASLPTVSIYSNDLEPVHLEECAESHANASMKDVTSMWNGESFDCSDSTTMDLAIELKIFQIFDLQSFNLVKQRKGTLIDSIERQKLACLKAELEQMQKTRDVRQNSRLEMPKVVSPTITKLDCVSISSTVPTSCEKASKSVEMNCVSQNQRDPPVRLELHSAKHLQPQSPSSPYKPSSPIINYNDASKGRYERRKTTDEFLDELGSLELGLRDSDGDSDGDSGKLGKAHNVQIEGSMFWPNLHWNSHNDETLKFSPRKDVTFTGTSEDLNSPGAKAGKSEPNLSIKRRRTIDPESAPDDVEESLGPRKRRDVNTGRRSECDA